MQQHLVHIVDRNAIIDKPIITKEGYLVCDVDFARCGVQYYRNFELGSAAIPNKKPFDLIGVLRSEKEVFSKESMDSFSLVPLTDGHPNYNLDSYTAKDHAVGTSGENVVRNGDYLRVRIKVTDSNVVDSMNTTDKKQFSAGYTSYLVQNSGVYKGQHYQVEQKTIRGNHIAVNINSARCGSGCSLKDSINNNMPRKLVIDSVTLEQPVLDAIASFEAQFDAVDIELSDTKKALADSQANAITIQANWDACKANAQSTIDSLKAENDQLKINKMNDEQINAIVESRIKVIADCQSIMPEVDIKLGSDDMVKSVVIAKCHDIADSIESKSKEYIQARFDILLAGINTADAYHYKGGKSPANGDSGKVVDSQAVRQKNIDNNKK